VIAGRLGDFDLSPATIASDTGIPLRTLQAAAGRAGTTLGRLIADRRLQKASRLLLSEPESSVTTIALDCGFSDPSYFARRFQQSFGTSPSKYRICH
jgi:AraC-like DNA-binding protein